MPHLEANLLAEWTGGSWKCGVPPEIKGISTDTRNLQPGTLYVAIKGPSFDGHDFVQAAFKSGAAGAIVGRYEQPSSRPLLHVKDTIRSLLDMASGYRKSVGAEILAVTGSVGKTTVKEMIADVLSALAPTARTRGNWNNEIGLPLSVLAMDGTARFGVFEVGMNHPGELRVLCEKLAPDLGVITAVGPVHLEFFDSVRSIALEKKELLLCLPDDGTAFLRRDDGWYDLLSEGIRCGIITVAMSGAADYVCERFSGHEDAMVVREQRSGEYFKFRLPAPGRHIAENALFAIAVGRFHGIAWEEIGRALERFKPQPMRWERTVVNGVEVINDSYNANPMSMSAALQTFSGAKSGGRKWLVLGGMHELGEGAREAHIKLGRTLAEEPWAGLITVGELGGLIAEGAEAGGRRRTGIFRCADHSEAAFVLNGAVAQGDSVLLKASRGERLEKILVEWRRIAAATGVTS